MNTRTIELTEDLRNLKNMKENNSKREIHFDRIDFEFARRNILY